MESTTFTGGRVGAFSPNGVAQVSHAGDAALFVQFYMHAVRQGAASEKAGREIFKDEEYVWIRFPGDRTKEVRRPVDMRGGNGSPPDPERWPTPWAAFKNSKAQVQEGTPLEEFPPLGASTVLNYKALNIHTVEQLAAVPDHVLHAMGTGGLTMRQKAQAWLAAAKDAAAVTQLQDELAKRDADIEMLRQQIADLAKAKGKRAD